MSRSEIEKNLADLAQALVLADWANLDSLDELPMRFGDLAAMLREAGHETEAEHCGRAASLAGQILCEAVPVAEGQERLARTLDALVVSLSGDAAGTPVDWPAAAPTGTDEALATSPRPAAPEAQAASVSAMVDEAIVTEFLARQSDVLDDVEKELLAIEAGDSAGDSQGINRFFHTLKGESSLLGLHDVADLCHAAEDVIQTDGIAASIDRLLDLKDWFITAFRHLRSEGPAPRPMAEAMAALRAGPPVVAATPQAAPPAPAAAAAPAEYDVAPYVGQDVLAGDLDLIQGFVEEAVDHLNAAEAHLLAIESNPKETEALNAVFRGFHTIKGLAGFIKMQHIMDLAHKAENLLDMARRGELELVGANMDVVLESVDIMKRLIEGLAEAMSGSGKLTEEEALAPLMGRLVAATGGGGRPAPAPVRTATTATAPRTAPEPAGAMRTSGFIPLGNMKKAAPAPVPAPAPPSATAAADDTEAAGKSGAPAKMKESMRVDAERLDHLIETIGELVIAASMVSQSPEVRNSHPSVKLSKDLDHLDKICRELQEIGMSLRMVPVRPVFQKMARLVRDLAKKQNRQVDFVMSGEDTELDKNVVEKIGDPLVHMVRNSVDHGIEADPADRIKLGKPERGLVELRAFHKGGNICIEIEDDGRGLNKAAITAKAISRGMMREGDVLADRDLFAMIFEPGFSTAKEVTDVSGRGVGMDVVRRNIEELRGTVEITSEEGMGSIFSIKLPLTLAIIEGMVVMVGREHYIIPTLSVVRLIRPAEKDIVKVFDKGEMLSFEGSHLPLFRLSRLFNVQAAGEEPHRAMVVVVEDEGRRIGLLADQLIGQQSIVIKSLGKSMQGIDGVAGGAIMSDGNVALILDVAGLVRVAHSVDTSVGRAPTAPAAAGPVSHGAAAAVDMLADLVLKESFADVETEFTASSASTRGLAPAGR